LVNKLSQFLSNPLLRNIFGQKENKVDLERIMNEKKILLISLSKGKLGEENSSFFGSMFVTKLYQAGMARASMKEEEREDFYLYVDEFHNLITTTFENLFTESRKYGLSIAVAHQYMFQLLPEVLATVLGNIGTIIVFRVGGDDAAKLVAEMTPVFQAEDMINLGTREFYIKMTIDGESFDPFSAETLKVLLATHASCKKEIIEQSRKKYAFPLGEVKKKLEEEERFKKETKEKNGKAEKKTEGEREKEDKEPEPLV